MAGISGGSQKSNSQQSSYSGLRGTPYQSHAEGQAYNSANQVQQLGNSIAQNPVNDFGIPQFRGFTGAQMMTGGRYGLGSNADLAMDQLGKQMFGYSSANYGSRGFVSPENQSAVVGSAITKALPQVLPQIQNWQQQQFQAPLQVAQYAMGGASTPAELWARLLGSQAQGSGSSSGFNFGLSVAQPK